MKNPLLPHTLLAIISTALSLVCPAGQDRSSSPEQTVRADSFAQSLFAATLPDDGSKNIVISPYGASQVLGLVSLGAKGETRQAFNTTLGFGADASYSLVAGAYSAWNASLASNNCGNVKLQLSNSLWLARGFEPKEQFLDLATDSLGATVRQVEMGPSAQQQINEHVAKETGGMIKRLLTSPPDKETILIAVNTIHLDAKWETPFQKHSTCKGAFHAPCGTKNVDFMHSIRTCRMFKDEKCKILFLPYHGDRLEMAFLLPGENTCLDTLKEMLFGNRLSEISQSAPFLHVNIALPKFEISSRIDLKKPLAKLGLGVAFSDRADFSRLSDLRTSISKAEQAAKIRVDEDGTQAAAATYIAIMRCALVHADDTFRADRPFFFALRDRKTSQILFAGRLSNP